MGQQGHWCHNLGVRGYRLAHHWGKQDKGTLEQNEDIEAMINRKVMQRKFFIPILLITISSLSLGCTNTTETGTSSTPGDSCSLEDETINLIRDWNRVSGELLFSYMDSLVSIPQFLEDADRLMPKLNRVVEDIRYLEECLPPDEGLIFIPFIETYNDKLAGYTTLVNALRTGSVELEETAIAMLMSSNEESVRMACEIDPATGEMLNSFPEGTFAVTC